MKKLFGVVMCLVLFAGASLPAFAQRRSERYAERNRAYSRYDNSRSTSYDRRSQYSRSQYNRRSQYDGRYDDRSFWQKHRDKLTVAMGAGGGAAIGGLTGGKKGAIIGALLGAGGSALYTYKLRDRDNRRNYRRR